MECEKSNKKCASNEVADSLDLSKGLCVLQHEKRSLEKKLQDLRSDHLNLERTQESLSAKYTQVKEVHSKMSETLKVAQHKVMQTQSIMEVVSADDEKRRQRIAQLHQLLAKSEEEQFNDISIFQDTLANLAETMIKARTLYSAESLSNEVANLKSPELFECDMQMLQDEYTHIIQELDLNIADESKQCALMGNIPLTQQKEVDKVVKTASQDIVQDIRTLQMLVEDLDAQNKNDHENAMDCD